MKHFMFITSSLTINPYVSESTQMLSTCTNSTKKEFIRSNPDLWLELSSRRDMSQIETYSLMKFSSLEIKGPSMWSYLKNAKFDTLFIDTVDIEDVIALKNSWNKARSDVAMKSFVKQPSFIYWEKL